MSSLGLNITVATLGHGRQGAVAMLGDCGTSSGLMCQLKPNVFRLCCAGLSSPPEKLYTRMPLGPQVLAVDELNPS